MEQNKKYTVETIDRRTYVLMENGMEAAKLTLSGWMGFTAEILIRSREHYVLEKKGVFRRTIILLKEGAEAGNLVMRFGMSLDITVPGGQIFVMKRKGIFSRTYLLRNINGEDVFEIKQRFRLRYFADEYEIIVHTYNAYENEILLLMLNIYGLIFIRKMAAAQG